MVATVLLASFSAANRSTGEENLTKNICNFGTQTINTTAEMPPITSSVTVSSGKGPISFHKVHDKLMKEIANAVTEIANAVTAILFMRRKT